MRDDGGQAIFYYGRHPITAEIILSKLRASRGNLYGLRPEDLYPHDQDHYGGLEANDVLAGGEPPITPGGQCGSTPAHSPSAPPQTGGASVCLCLSIPLNGETYGAEHLRPTGLF